MQRLGVDIGGTFTDLVCLGSDGSVEIGKVFSTPSKSQQAVVRGIEGLRSRSTGDPYHLTHSSTIGTNALLTRKGARVGLIVTEGFEHVLHIARGRTPGPLSGWISFEKPDPAADLVDTRSVPERVTARGEVMTPLEVDRVVRCPRAHLAHTGHNPNTLIHRASRCGPGWIRTSDRRIMSPLRGIPSVLVCSRLFQESPAAERLSGTRGGNGLE